MTSWPWAVEVGGQRRIWIGGGGRGRIYGGSVVGGRKSLSDEAGEELTQNAVGCCRRALGG